jgi:RES domain-containing protein
MLVYRIALAKYADSLKASGRAARWNPNDFQMIYTSSSRALACLENIVHRSQVGLMSLFSVMVIEIPDKLKQEQVTLNDLPSDWKEYGQMLSTQSTGEHWLRGAKSAILKVPSAIIEEEVNYLINPLHKDFLSIKLIATEPFVFDSRLKS